MVNAIQKMRDSLIHPRLDEDETPLEDYKKNLERGMWGIIEIMDCLSKAIFKKHLRKQILDLKPDV